MNVKFETIFQNNISGFQPDAENIYIKNRETERFEHAHYVLVRDIEKDAWIYNIRLNCEIPYTFFSDAILLGSLLFMAVENYVYLFDIKSKEQKQFRLPGYFEEFRYRQNNLIIVTHTHLSLFHRGGANLWISDKLAKEKISITAISAEKICGLGNWNDELKEFSISMTDGKALKVAQGKRKRNIFANLFTF